MTSGRKPDVRRVRSSLVATLSRANPPLIWRFDLDRNHSFTLALQGQDNEWELGVTSPKGEFNPIARFPARDDAEEALAAIGKELGRGRLSWVLGFLKMLALLMFLLFLAVLGWSLLLRMAAQRPIRIQAPQQSMETVPALPAPPPVAAAPPAAPAVTNGVPLPADEVLQPPKP
jgi:hypothetical protein